MSVSTTSQDGKLQLTHSSGSSAEIYLFGATVTSFKTADGTERLFVSSKSKLDGSKAIRGGIPVVFPIFGPPPAADKIAADSRLEPHGRLSQHGFARTSVWTLEKETNEGVDLVLEPTDEIKKVFAQAFKLTYSVTLSASALTTALRISNASAEPLLFQTLLHTYLAHPAPHSAKITPLQNLNYADKVRGGQTFTESRSIVTLDEETDRVYHAAPAEIDMTYGETSGGGVKVRTKGFRDATVWNPGPKTGAGMVDMEDKGWEKYICIEPGYVAQFFELPAGEDWTGEMAVEVY